MPAPVNVRKLRFAWLAGCAIACVPLIAMQVRNYWREHNLASPSHCTNSGELAWRWRYRELLTRRQKGLLILRLVEAFPRFVEVEIQVEIASSEVSLRLLLAFEGRTRRQLSSLRNCCPIGCRAMNV